MAVTIRGYRPADLEAIYEICLLIGDNGKDATPLFRERRILGDLYAGAYGRFAPELAFAAEDQEGVCGFTLGVLDTVSFDALLEREWWPALRQRYRIARDGSQWRRRRGLQIPDGQAGDDCQKDDPKPPNQGALPARTAGCD